MSCWRRLVLTGVLALLLGGAGAPSDGSLPSAAQKIENLCGPLCLTFCARRLGVEANVRQVAALSDMDESGASMAGLQNAAQQLGLEARAVKLRLGDLRKITAETPAIAHVDGDHFVVAYMGSDGRVIVAEPPTKWSRVSPEEFGRRWSGAALIVSRPGQQPQFAALWPYVLLAGGVAMVGAALWLWRHGRRTPESSHPG
ncbi:MAG: cysteine peptidase family C39 domain-containing protein [Candidatus Brocadiia bacterium]